MTAETNTLTICHNQNHHPATLTISGCDLSGHLVHGGQVIACPVSRPIVSTEEDIASESFIVYPNPSSDMMTVAFTSEKAENHTMTVVDIAGRVILSENKTVN